MAKNETKSPLLVVIAFSYFSEVLSVKSLLEARLLSNRLLCFLVLF